VEKADVHGCWAKNYYEPHFERQYIYSHSLELKTGYRIQEHKKQQAATVLILQYVVVIKMCVTATDTQLKLASVKV
jgi:hypothetical protein